MRTLSSHFRSSQPFLNVMIKLIIILFIIISLNTCRSRTIPKATVSEFGYITIDPSLKKKFFKFPPQRIQSDKGVVKINSYIRDTIKGLPLFDTCRCILSREDTLVMEFKPLIGAIHDSIIIKVFNDRYTAIYSKWGLIYPAVSGSLSFNDKPQKQGQEIFGELGIEFVQDPQKSTGFFRGPFRCTIE